MFKRGQDPSLLLRNIVTERVNNGPRDFSTRRRLCLGLLQQSSHWYDTVRVRTFLWTYRSRSQMVLEKVVKKRQARKSS